MDRNLNIEMYGQEYSILDIEREDIIFNQPVEWNLLIEDQQNLDNFHVAYKTPPIILSEQDYLDGFKWYKTITLETDFTEGYSDIIFNTTIPTTEEYYVDLGVVGDEDNGNEGNDYVLSYEEISDNELEFLLNRLDRKYEFTIKGYLESLDFENVSFDYLRRLLDINGTEYEYFLNPEANVLIPIEYSGEEYSLESYEMGPVIFGEPIRWDIVMIYNGDSNNSNNLDNYDSFDLGGLDSHNDSKKIYISYETPPIFMQREDSYNGKNWTSNIQLSTDFIDGYSDFDIILNIPDSLLFNVSHKMDFDFYNGSTEYVLINIPILDNYFDFDINGIASVNLTQLNLTYNATNETNNTIIKTHIKNTYAYDNGSDYKGYNNYTNYTNQENEPYLDDYNKSMEVFIEIPELSSSELLLNITKELVDEETELDEIKKGLVEKVGVNKNDVIKEKEEKIDKLFADVERETGNLFESVILVDNSSASVEQIEFKNLYIKDRAINIGLKDLEIKDSVQSYAIDPENLDFTNATVTVIAKGTDLYKCKEWDFANDVCLGEWELFKSGLIPGQEYTFELGEDDPGFMEILISKADHLDESRNFIADIYDGVKELDDVWSESIGDGEYVRLMFEANLTYKNDITIFPRVVSGNPSIEVYEKDGDLIVAEFDSVFSNTYNKIYLDGLEDLHGSEYGQDSFDLRIVNGVVEFDHIIDPLMQTIYDNCNGASINSSTFTTYTTTGDSTDIYASGTGYYQIDSDDNAELTLYTSGLKDNFTKFTVEAMLDEDVGNGRGWIFGIGTGSLYGQSFCQANTGWVPNSGYAVCFLGNNGGTQLYRINSGTAVELVDESTSDVTTGVFANYTMELNSSGVFFFIDDTLWINSSDTTYSQGYITLSTGGGGSNRGNITVNNVWSYEQDTIPPSLAIESPENTTYSDNEILVNITASDFSGIDNVWYNWNGTDYDYTTPVDITFDYLQNTLQVWANDTEGNENYTNVSFYVEVIPPSIIIETPESGNQNNKTLLVNISTSGSAIDEVWYNWNGTNYSYSGEIEVTFDEGNNTLHAWVNNSFGTMNYTNVSFDIDTAVPSLSIVSPENTTYYNSTISLEINAADAHIDNVWYNFDGTDYDYSGVVNVTFDYGQNNLDVWVNDTFGNINYSNVSFIAYKSSNDAALNIWDDSDSGMVWANTYINFYSDYFNITGTEAINGTGVVCKIRFNETGTWSEYFDMSFNETLELYEYKKTFDAGTYDWGVECNGTALGYDLISMEDEVVVSDSPLPYVQLETPQDGYFYDVGQSTTVTFSCNVSDLFYELHNLSLYITNSSNENFKVNQTKSLSGLSGDGEWELELGMGEYTWNCKAYDVNGNYSFAVDDYSLELNWTDRINPTVTDLTLVDGQQYNLGDVVNVTVNVTDNIGVLIVQAKVDYEGGSTTYKMTNVSHKDIYNLTFITYNQDINNITILARDAALNLNDTEGTWFNVSYTTSSAIYCEESPCIAGSDLIMDVGTGEPNQPNTLDSCTDGNSGTYMDDENLENITVVSMNGSDFREGDTIEVNITAYCYNDGSDDQIQFAYANTSATYPNWKNVGYIDPCPAGGFQTISQQFVLDSGLGVHAIRGIITYDTTPAATTCGTSSYDDNDDLEILVQKAREFVNPNVTIIIPNSTNVYFYGAEIPIEVNVSDKSDIEEVYVTISKGILNWQINLTDYDSDGIYTGIFDDTFQIENHTITAYARDEFGNINNTEETWFWINDTGTLVIESIECLPAVIERNEIVHCWANASDPNVTISNVWAEVQFPNTSVYSMSVNLESTDIYNFSFSDGSIVKDYLVTWYANNSNGVERTDIDTFKVVEYVKPSVELLAPYAGRGYNTSQNVNLTATVTDNVEIDNVWAKIRKPDKTYVYVNLTNTGGDNYFTYWNQAQTQGIYNITIYANDTSGNINNSDTTWINVTYVSAAALYCEDSPCIAGSDLIMSRGSLSPAEPNQPNTVDACGDGSDGSYMSDENLENITIVDLNGSDFRARDTIEINITGYCYNDGSDDQFHFVYSNVSGASPQWKNMHFVDPCPGSGFQTVSRQIVLDNTTGIHVIRGIVTYDTTPAATTCGTSAYDDQDDIEIYVDKPRENNTPYVNITNPSREFFAVNESVWVLVNVTDQTDVIWVKANITWQDGGNQLLSLPQVSGDFYGAYFTNTSLMGQYNITIIANDTFSNINDSEEISFNVTLPDLSVSEIEFIDSSSMIEGDEILVRVNISNNGNVNATDFKVNMNASLWNGSKIFNETFISDSLDIESNSYSIVEFIWTSKIGTYVFDVFADYLYNVSEINELDNELSGNVTQSAWELFYGQINSSLFLSDSVNQHLLNWTIDEPMGNLYYYDYDASFYPFDLLPLDGEGDLQQADTALGIGGFNDSIVSLFDRNGDGYSDDVMTIEISGSDVANIPVINSTNSSDFIIGLLYDSADGIGYDGTQDLVFITEVKNNQQGRYGIYDYEIKIPSPLEKLEGSFNLVSTLTEFR